MDSREAESDHSEARRRKRSRGESESSLAVSRRHDNERRAASEKEKQQVEEKSKLMTEEEVETGRVGDTRSVGVKRVALTCRLFCNMAHLTLTSPRVGWLYVAQTYYITGL